ncbi:MAG TPA: SgcJ/EcaC family oxidoreductase [Terriglobales bacterium]|jgi:uncharacterized protein (TIGR02246 family)|nr:SgcJ/EcaC family oxidoreductase [Terriglobales bacterium]
MSDARAQSGLSDSRAIEALVAELTDAWNRGDARAFSARFAADGSFTNVLGIVAYGREIFELRHAEIFRTIYQGSVLQQSIGRLYFIRPDVAVVDVDAAVSGYLRLPPGVQAANDGALRAKLQLVVTREDSEWWIAAFHNVDVKPLPLRP